MPKIQAATEYIHDGMPFVRRDALDRANAEIERLEAVQKKLGRIVMSSRGPDRVCFGTVGIMVEPDGTVTEIGHG